MEKVMLLATTNAHKIAEIKAIFAACGLSGWGYKTLADYPDYQAPPEDGETFADNAALKAGHAALMSGLVTLADDSGLTVEALFGAPGVHSARYAGEQQNDQDNRKKTIGRARGRTGR